VQSITSALFIYFRLRVAALLAIALTVFGLGGFLPLRI
jgi:hypothetical protein